MSSQQSSTPQDSAKLVWCAVAAAWLSGLTCATAFWRILMDLKFGSGHGHWLPWWVNWGLVLFTPAVMTLAAYFLTRAALNSRE